MSDELGRILVAAQEVVDHAESTYRARNGRVMSIEADDGEACYIVHSDWIAQLGFALEAFSARPGQSELRTLAEKMAEALKEFADCAEEWDGESNSLNVEFAAYDPPRMNPSALVADFRAARQSLTAWNEWKERNGG